MRIKGFGCKEPVSWKPVFLISKYVGVSGLSFATKTNSGKAGIFFDSWENRQENPTFRAARTPAPLQVSP